MAAEIKAAQSSHPSAGHTPEDLSRTLQCSEIWGGTGRVRQSLTVPGLDIWIISQPHAGSEGGGDIHYIGLCGHGLMSRFVVADVSGHGAVVKPLADALRSLLAESMTDDDMTALVAGLNDRFADLSGEGQFATAVAATYLSVTRQLLLVNAGHPQPLWYRASQQHWRTVDRDTPVNTNRLHNLPLGVVGQTGYTEARIELAAGDLMLLFTDELIEAHNDDGEQLGLAGLKRLAEQIEPYRPAEFGPALLQAVANHRAGHPADDDTTLMVLHHNGNVPDLPNDLA